VLSLQIVCKLSPQPYKTDQTRTEEPAHSS
jgi:hypothetical protein